jgi:ABC-type amino acid transport substrate-binding protein
VLRVGAAAESRAYFPAVMAVYAEMGLPAPEFVLLPPERVLRNLENGELDADLGRIQGVARDYANLVETTVPIAKLSLYAVVRKGFPEVNGSNLKGLRFGYVRGTKLAERFVESNQLQSLSGTSNANLARMVASDRMDVLLVTSSASLPHSVDYGDLVVMQPKPLYAASAVHVFHKRWEDLVPRFDAAVRRMIADGRLAKLLPN